MKIRLASTIDLPIIEKLARAVWPKTYATIISAAQIDYMLNWMYSTPTLLKQLDSGHEFYIISHKEIDIGFIGLEWYLEDNLRQLKINKLYVLDAYQGAGAGKSLVKKAMQLGLQSNVNEIFLQVNKANKAVGFYKNLGFTIKEAAVFDIGEGFVMDDYIMSMAL